jgi:hypothetical protein
MTEYDVGPGDRSDREWESPDKKDTPQARRRRVTLPPWALLAILVAIIILLCVSLILIIRAIRGGGEDETPTPATTATRQIGPTSTQVPVTWTPASVITQTPTATVVLPIEGTPEPTPLTEIAPGATVVVQGTLGVGLNLREQPSTYSAVVDGVDEGTELAVIEGPHEADGYVWWKLRAPNGAEGWGAANWLVLKTE